MKRTEILPTVEKAIAARRPLASARYYLTFVNDTIRCVGGDPFCGSEFVICSLTVTQIAYGLTSREWNRIEAKIARILRQKGYLCEQSKP